VLATWAKRSSLESSTPLESSELEAIACWRERVGSDSSGVGWRKHMRETRKEKRRRIERESGWGNRVRVFFCFIVMRVWAGRGGYP
jgi:hypothetical protein